MSVNSCAPPVSSQRHSQRSLLPAVIVAVALLVGQQGDAYAEAIKCQREIARASSKFTQAKIKALAHCQDQILIGKAPGPCPDAQDGVADRQGRCQAACRRRQAMRGRRSQLRQWR